MDSRISKVLGRMLAALGALAIVMAMVSPAGASPDGHTPNGKATGYGHNHAVVIDDSGLGAQCGDQSADQSANQDCGAYCPNGVGLPSGNGNGDGNATGQPCAGCVGNADDKNPPGQFKDGSDHNNGYECDGNNGIGKTNPAHTGCSPTTTVPSTTTTVPGSTTTTVPGSTTTSSVPGNTTTTVAGDTTTTVPTNVLGENFTRPADPSASTSPLAFTGGAFGRLFWSGIAFVVLGIVVLAQRRVSARRA